MNLKGKNVLVTGGAKRVGRAICLAFAARGARVLIHCHRSRKEAVRLAKELGRGPDTVFAADLSKKAQCDRLAAAVVRKWGVVDVLVNNASVFYATPLEKTSEKDWDLYNAVHVKAPFFLSRALAKGMKKKGEGRIVNLTEWMERRPSPTFLVYGVSKAALVQLTQVLAKVLAPEVLVSAVCPGPVLAPDDFTPAQKRKLAERIPLKRWGTPEDVAATVVFLAESDYITGSAHIVDGGHGLRS